MEIRVDRDRCAASGLCVLLVPEVFDQSEEDGRVLLRTAAPGAEQARSVRAAVTRCPSGAITMTEGTGMDDRQARKPA